jgi:hypothetical protein
METEHNRQTGRFAHGLRHKIQTTPLLKTPSAQDPEREGMKSGYSGAGGTLPQEMASGRIEQRLLKAPRTSDANTPTHNPDRPGQLRERIFRASLPTPAAGDCNGPNGPEHLAKERGHHDQLANRIAMLPTPKKQNSTGAGEHGQEGKDLQTTVGTRPGLKLQPAFVEWMMGYPLGFTDIEVTASKRSATPSSRKSPSKS